MLMPAHPSTKMLQAGRICSQLAQRRAAAAACSATEQVSSRRASTQADAQPEAGPGPGSDLPERTALFLEMYRRHNSSLQHLEGQVIGARVFKTDKRYVWLDPGYNKYVKFARKALHLSQLLSSTEGGLRTSPEDFRIGDVLQFTVQELETPYGDMQLAVERPVEKDKYLRVWEELRQAMLANTPVMGRVLNAVNSGFAIGVAGFVCFCPISQMEFLTATKIGVLQPFQVNGALQCCMHAQCWCIFASAQLSSFVSMWAGRCPCWVERPDGDVLLLMVCLWNMQVVSIAKERRNVILHDWHTVEKQAAHVERRAQQQALYEVSLGGTGGPGE